MKISCSWLKEFVPFELTPQQLAQRLTFSGLETSVIDAPAGAWTKVITAQVLSVERHPNADKLSCCLVTDGTHTSPVVCGAPNVRAGQIVALAQIGATLPPETPGAPAFSIRKSKIRGVESHGMLCSEQELGIAAAADGILVLPSGTPLGKPLEDVLGSGDTLLEIEINSNRPDCLSHWGVAREVGATLGLPLTLPSIMPASVGDDFCIDNREPSLCTRYIGCSLDGVTVGPSPAWMVQRLEACGLRSINNIVDVTNYVLLELGHPLHVFDAERMAGSCIVVRRAAENESLRALDGKTYAMNDTMIVIADQERPQAIAGVIGGEASGVTAATRRIYLESALFDAPCIRRTSKKLNISTDSSYRFERGAAWEVAELASWRAVNLIQQLAGGTLVARRDSAPRTYVPRMISFRPARAAQVTAVDFSRDEMHAILNRLGMTVNEAPDSWSVGIPSWRIDVQQEVDIIEELIRVKGYEHIPVRNRPVVPVIQTNLPVDGFRTLLTSLGFSEAVNYSFAECAELERYHLQPAFRIANPLSRENEALRPSMLPGLMKNLTANIAQGYSRVCLFEEGTVFTPDGERRTLGILACGPVWTDAWWRWDRSDGPTTYDFYFFQGLLQRLLPAYARILRAGQPAPFFHPGKCAAIDLKGKRAAEFGVLKPHYAIDLPSEVCYASLYLDVWEQALANDTAVTYKPIRRYPPVRRDLSIVVQKTVSFDRVEKILDSMQRQADILQQYELFSRFEDAEKLGADKVSYSMHLTLRHAERTLTEQDSMTFMATLTARLQKDLGAVLR